MRTKKLVLKNNKCIIKTDHNIHQTNMTIANIKMQPPKSALNLKHTLYTVQIFSLLKQQHDLKL